ncbi:MAG: zinc-binding dehydrogenase, partial [Candidatus Sumerlaeota bacterium]|nr:zinc-binding dehydrogenase [Candidatus Sumerlaeota bacterium]
GPRLADRIALLGAGPIGLLMLKTAKVLGASEITVADKNPARLALAKKSGADRTVGDLDALPKDSYDAVIDATGAPAVIAQTVSVARPGATILWFGVAPRGARMEIEPFEVFHKGLSIHASFTSLRNSVQAIRLLQSGRIDVSALVTHRLPLEGLRRGIETIEQGAENAMKVLILPNG